MKRYFFLVVALLDFITVGDKAYCAVKSGGRSTKRSSAKRAKTVSVQNVSGRVSGGSFSGNVRTVSTKNVSDGMNCGIMADATNNQAKRLCAIAMADALKTYCKSYPCQSKLKVELSFNFDLPTLSSVSADVNGNSCSGKDLNTFCTAFQSELLDGLWDLYSEKNIRERKNCNMAMAKYSAAQDCFQYIQAEKNQSVGGIFDSSKISGLDKGIDSRCGRDAILKKYKTIALDELDDADMNTYFGMASMNEDGTVSNTSGGYQGKKKLSSTVASLFANVGDNTWNVMGQIGKLADLKLDMKSSTYPRELVVIANTFVTEGETACGKDFASTMQDTSFDLVDNRSSLEIAISKKGLLKGVFDFTLDNTVALVSEDKAEDIKKKGIAGKVKEAIDKRNEKKANRDVYPSADSDNTFLIACKGNVDEVTIKAKSILSNIDSAIAEIEKADEKYREKMLAYNPKIISNLSQLLEFDRSDDSEITMSTSPNLSELRSVVNKLKSVPQFNCKGKGFVNPSSVTYKFEYDKKGGDAIGAIIAALVKSRDDFMPEYDASNADNKEELKSKFEKFKGITKK
ncbi:MAG: hypothetical protein IJ638_00770 [Alphaproteobacteria bacterium]|nr:hypothetical protein [Alphaproteobacteria bacterium]